MLPDPFSQHVETVRKARSGLVVAFAACIASSACSEPFKSCADTRSCPAPGGAGAAGFSGAQTGGSQATGGAGSGGAEAGRGGALAGSAGSTAGEGGSAISSGGNAGIGGSGAAGAAGLGGTGPSLPATGLVLRLRADLGITRNGDAVQAWADQSGNKRDAAQATAGAQPAYLGNWKNGKPAVHFDATDDVLRNTNSAIFGSGDDVTLFVVGARDADPDTAEINDKWFGLLATGKEHRFQTATVSSTQYAFTDGSSINVSMTVKFEMGKNPAYIMWASDGEGGDSKLLVRINGALKATNTDMSNFSDKVSGFEVGGANNNYGGKKIGEIIAYNRLLSNPEIAEVESYIKSFWGTF